MHLNVFSWFWKWIRTRIYEGRSRWENRQILRVIHLLASSTEDYSSTTKAGDKSMDALDHDGSSIQLTLRNFDRCNFWGAVHISAHVSLYAKRHYNSLADEPYALYKRVCIITHNCVRLRKVNWFPGKCLSGKLKSHTYLQGQADLRRSTVSWDSPVSVHKADEEGWSGETDREDTKKLESRKNIQIVLGAVSVSLSLA